MSRDPESRGRDTNILAPIIFNMTGDTRRVMTSCDPKLVGHPATFGQKYGISQITVTDGIGQTLNIILLLYMIEIYMIFV